MAYLIQDVKKWKRWEFVLRLWVDDPVFEGDVLVSKIGEGDSGDSITFGLDEGGLGLG
mgnify:CR=1 FL=1